MKRSFSSKETSGYLKDNKRGLIGILVSFPLTTRQPRPLQHFLFNFAQLQFFAILMYLEIIIPSRFPKTSLTNYVQRVVKGFVLIDIFQDNYMEWTYSAVLICTWSYLISFLLIFGLLGIESLKKIKRFSLPKPFLHFIFQLHLAGFHWIINIILLVPFSTTTTRNQASSIGLYGKSTAIILTNIFSLLINNVIGTILALFCIEPFKGQREYASHTSSPQLVLFLSKMVFAPLVVFLNKDNNDIGTSLNVLGLILSLIQLFILIKFLPFYSPRAMKFALSWNFVGIWVLIVNIISIISAVDLEASDLNDIAYLKILMIPFCIKLALLTFNKLVKSYLTTNMDSLTSEETIFKKLLSFSLMAQEIKAALNIDAKLNEYEAYFFGDLADHSKICIDSECICKFDQEDIIKDLRDIKENKDKLELYKEKRTSEIFRVGIERIKRNSKLKLVYASQILEGENAKLDSALAFIYSLSKEGLETFQLNVKLLRYNLLKVVEEKLDQFFNSKDQGILNLKVYTDFQEAQTNFKDLLLSGAKNYRDFWSYYQGSNFKMVSLYNKSREMEIEATEVENLWSFYMNQHPLFYTMMGEYYCIYLSLIRNLPFHAMIISKKYVWKKKGFNAEAKKIPVITEANLNLPDTITFYVSMTKEKIGRIQYVSSNVESVLKFSSEKLIGKNINILMSPSLAKDHDKALSQQIQRTKSLDGKNYKMVSGYVKNRQGYYLPMNTYVTIFPYIQKELTYIGVLRVNETPYEHIVLNGHGYIDGFTERIGKVLKLSIERTVHISEICPDLLFNNSNQFMRLISLMSDNDEEVINTENTQKKRKSFVRSSKFSRKEESDRFEEENWRQFLFIQQNEFKSTDQRKNPEKNYLTFDIKIIPRKYFKKDFYILLVSSATDHKNDASSKNSASEKDVDQEFSFENDLDIPAERPELFKESFKVSNNNNFLSNNLPLSQDQRLLSEIYSVDKEALLMSAKKNSSFLDVKAGRFSEFVNSHKKQLAINLTTEAFETRPDSLIKKNDNLFIINTTREEMIKNTERSWNDISNRPHSMDGVEDKIPVKLSEKASSIATNGENKKIEQAAHAIPKSTVVRNVCIVTTLFFLLCFGQLIGFGVYAERVLMLVQGNIMMLRLSDVSLNELVYLERYAELITLIRADLIRDDRFYNLFGTSTQESLGPNLFADADYLRFVVGRLRTSLNQTDLSLQKKLHKWMIPLKFEEGPPIEKNVFDAMNEMVMRSFTIINSVDTVFEQEDENVNFILNNSFNELLTTAEGMSSIFIEDNNFKLKNFEELIMIFLLIVLLFGGFLIVLLLCQQRKFIKERNNFIELLLRLNEQEISHTLHQVKTFIGLLNDNNVQAKHLTIQNLSFHKNSEKIYTKSQHKRAPQREVNMQNINKNQHLIFVLGLIIVILFSIPFIYFFLSVRDSTSEIRSKFESLIESNRAFYNIILLSGSFFQYIRTDGKALLRNNPINEEWQDIFQKVVLSQNNLLNLLIYYQKQQTCSASTRATLEHLIIGNLCTAESLSFLAELCPAVPEALLSNGVQGLNSFSITTLGTVKTEYDNSERTHDDAKAILDKQDFINLDLMIATFQTYGFIMLRDILQDCTVESINQIKDDLKILLIVFVLILIIFVPLVIYFFLNKMEQERVEWRKVSRKIPSEILMNNKMLKNYIVKKSKITI